MGRPRLHPPVKVGDTFERLEVIAAAEPYISPRGQAYTRWLCRCKCGVEKPARETHLTQGRIVSCGCLGRERADAGKFKHGMSKSREHAIWQAMLARCYNPNVDQYPNYGGRGITVCDRWRFGEGGKDGFSCFLADMGRRPSTDHSIERRDNDAIYKPGNCYWGTRVEQANNKRNNRIVTFAGERMTLAEAQRRSGIPLGTLEKRLKKWPEARWFDPVKPKRVA